jgi:hypothetical protein
MDVAISLGMYISERNEGNFKDAFITFSNNPQLQYLTGITKREVTTVKKSGLGNVY